MSHRAYTHSANPLSFILANLLSRWSVSHVSLTTTSPFLSRSHNGQQTSLTVWTRGVSNPRRSPHLRCSTSVFKEKSTFPLDLGCCLRLWTSNTDRPISPVPVSFGTPLSHSSLQGLKYLLHPPLGGFQYLSPSTIYQPFTPSPVG